jgi:DNA-binding MarR family transcriptional regulator
VRRQRDSGDDRIVHLSVTVAGKRAVHRARSLKSSVLLETLERLPPPELRQLNHHLENLLRRIRSSEAASE